MFWLPAQMRTDADGSKTRPSARWGRDRRTSLATSPAAAQLPNVPIAPAVSILTPCPSAPSCPPVAQPQAQVTPSTWSRGWTPTASLKNVRQVNSDGRRISFSAFPSPAKVHSGEIKAWHTEMRGS